MANPGESREHHVNSWEEFETLTEEIRLHSGSDLFFRGQSDSGWPLTSTLDREPCGPETLFRDYYRSISTAKSEIESLTGRTWDVPDYPTVERWVSEYEEFSFKLGFGRFPAYDYMVHLRHHGFPSPLLDWTRSPYVAAYFAFSKFRSTERAAEARVSIYAFAEPRFRVHGNNMPVIFRLGPYIRTHRRHFLQQCDYTLCVIFDGEWRFCPYQKLIDRPKQNQARFWKFNIPYSERSKVLKKLDKHNLNAFTLFGSEESLMETVALRTWHFGQESFPELERRKTAMGLEEMKIEAAAKGFTEIRRDDKEAPWVALKAWNGFSPFISELPNLSVSVEYWLEGNRVRVTRALDDQEYWYTLR